MLAGFLTDLISGEIFGSQMRMIFCYKNYLMPTTRKIFRDSVFSFFTIGLKTKTRKHGKFLFQPGMGLKVM